MEFVLQTDKILKNYGGVLALDDVSMQVREGEIYGLIGRNGAGKTTLLRIITGLQAPDAGSYKLFGIEHSSPDIYKARARIGGIVETPAVNPSLTARENCVAQNILLGNPSSKDIDGTLKYIGLPPGSDRKAKDMSLGQRQRLSIAMALIGNPDFLVLDEPTNGLDPQGMVEIRELIVRLNRERNVTVLISSHLLGELAKVAGRFGVIHKGRLIREITRGDVNDRCRKKAELEISDTTKVPVAFDEAGLAYKIISRTKAEIYTGITVGKLAEAVASVGAELVKFTAVEEDLESYFINLVGGGR